MDKNPVLLSICCNTYNHENYISQAIEGFLAQKTSFNFEIIIHDDASTDATASIVKKYEQEHLNLIKAIYQTENQYSKGIKPWPNFVFPIARGKYIALCEGDDYWTDPYKLQKQVDFLEANPEYNLTCHRYQTYNETTKTLTEDGNEDCFTDGNEEGLTFDAPYIFRRWISKTLTVVFRNDHDYSSLLSQYQYARDVHLFYHILKNGKGFCFSFVGGVYRLHNGGVHSTLSDFQKAKEGLKIFIELRKNNKKDKILESKYHEIIKHYLNNLALQFILSLKDKQYSKTAFRIDKEFLPIIILHLPYLLLITGKILLNLNRTSITKKT